MQAIPKIMDGGTGTELERLDVPMNGSAWSAEAVLTHPEILLKVHTSFLEAGARLLIANTFSCGFHNLRAAGLERHFRAANARAVEIANQAVNEFDASCLVAAGISTTTFSGPLDYSRLPEGEQAVNYYARQAIIQRDAGAQLIILEMMRDIAQTAYALEGALTSGLPVWVGFSCMATGTNEIMLMDTDIPLRSALDALDLSSAQAVGIMHTLIEHTHPSLDILQPRWNGPLFAYPHAGHFVMPNWIFQDAITPDDFAAEGLSLLNRGVDCVGGCCGITPAHIKALHRVAGD